MTNKLHKEKEGLITSIVDIIAGEATLINHGNEPRNVEHVRKGLHRMDIDGLKKLLEVYRNLQKVHEKTEA